MFFHVHASIKQSEAEQSCSSKVPAASRYKKNVMMVRGRFRPFTLLHNDMLQGAAAQFFCEPEDSEAIDNVSNAAWGLVLPSCRR